MAGAQAEGRADPAFADTIFTGGLIMTLNEAHPMAEALAVLDGKIIAMGSHDEVIKLKGDRTEVVDLAGKTVVPDIIGLPPAHSGDGQRPDAVPLHPPPAGDVHSIADIVAKMKAYIREKQIPEGTPAVGQGYDEAALAERRHPTRGDLDRISIRHPVLILHASERLLVANSAALEQVNYTGDTLQPTVVLIKGQKNARLTTHCRVDLVRTIQNQAV